MDKKDSLFTHEPGWLKDFETAPSELVQRFAPEQMVECQVCLRANPPTRLNCFYCAAQLEISEKNRKLLRPNFRKLENWEKGFNVVCHAASETKENKASEIADFLQLETETLTNLLRSKLVLPVARVEKIEEAQIVENRLQDFGLNCSIVADENLMPEKLPTRVRGLKFAENLRVSLTGTNEITIISWNDLRVFVTGAIFESKRESFQQRKRGETIETGDASEFNLDDRVLDFYDRTNSLGYRISAKSFDFSCLGERKILLAGLNFIALVEELKRRATQAVFDDHYRQARHFLNQVWMTEERKDSIGVKHMGIGKINLSSRILMNNQNQFTRYSRLAAHLASGAKA